MKTYSRIYLAPESPRKDSPRLRKRLESLLKLFSKEIAQLMDLSEMSLGIALPTYSYAGSINFAHFCEYSKLEDILDFITLVYRELPDKNEAVISKGNFINQINTIFVEESSAYKMSNDGIVHLAQDHEFERLTGNVIQGLQQNQYNDALAHYLSALSALTAIAPDFRSAIKNIYEANECVFKTKFPSESSLSPGDFKRKANGTILSGNASSKTLESFEKWLTACQEFRHAQGEGQQSAVDKALADCIVSQGASFLRWQIDLYSRSG